MAYVFRSAQYLAVLSERTHPACAAEADHSARHGRAEATVATVSAHEESHRILPTDGVEINQRRANASNAERLTCSMFAAAVSTRDVSYL
jgi:hypothetical protein